MPTTLAPKASDTTRTKLLWAAFAEFYRNGFQGGSLNHIVETAGATKGALFHHFAGKQDLGYAVLDEIIEQGSSSHQRDIERGCHDAINKRLEEKKRYDSP